ncbi:MAG TPA: hypothetical protein EYQ24_00915 [Bacteroidetes bacterium]|nr:hypothetical protein [Bacteroidota bacterium]
MRRTGATRLAALALILGVSVCPSPFAATPAAQDVLELLRDQRRRAVLTAAAESAPAPEPRGVRPYPQTDWALLRLDAREARRQFVTDSLAQARADSLTAALAAADTVIHWRKVAPQAQAGFLADYRETFWRALSGYGASPIDTMETLQLRGRMTQFFGTPTRNAAAARQERYAGSEYVQFEYWLVANDSIPVLVLDTHGPFGRGLLIASDEAYADQFVRLKRNLAQTLLRLPPTVEFVDYYHDPERKQWFKTGFDGTAFFTEQIRRPRWARNFGGDKWLIHR